MIEAETVSIKARLVARSKDMLWMRDVLINIRDGLETDVDRVFFGSTNDADDFREIVDKLDDWQWSVIMKDGEGEDLYAEIRALRSSLAEKEALLKEAGEALEPFAQRAGVEYVLGRDEAPAPETHVVGNELMLTIADLRRAASIAAKIQENQIG